MIKLHDSFPATLTGLDLVIGDSAKLLASVPPDTIDLVVTSPPYDGLRTYNGYYFDFETIARQLYRVMKPGGCVVWIVGDATIDGDETGTSFRQALFFKQCGFALHDTMIYEKTGTGACGSNRSYWQIFEYMFVFAKGKLKTVNRLKDTRNAKYGSVQTRGRISNNGDIKDNKIRIVPEFSVRSNVWRIQQGNNGDNNDTGHPAPFPEILAADHIASWSNPGDLIMDIFSGSGTTGKMCVLGGRNFLGFEISKEYALASEKRINYVAAQLKMF